MAPVNKRKWSFERLNDEVTGSAEQIIRWLQSEQLLSASAKCLRCSTACTLTPSEGVDEYSWKCKSKECGMFTPVRANTFFAASKLPLRHIVQLLFCWCTAYSPRVTAFHLQIIEPCVDVWYRLLHHVLDAKHRAMHSTCTLCGELCKPLADFETEQLEREKAKLDHDARRLHWSEEAKKKMWVEDIVLVNGQAYHLYRIPEIPAELKKRYEIVSGQVSLASDKHRRQHDFQDTTQTLKSIYAPKDVYAFENMD